MKIQKTVFYKSIAMNHEGIAEKRLELMYKQAAAASKKNVDNLQEQLDDIELKIMDLEDLAPTTTVSLMPADGKFDGKSWIKQLQDLGEKKLILDRKYEVAKGINDKYFVEVEEEA